jgi:hypothetical protein
MRSSDGGDRPPLFAARLLVAASLLGVTCSTPPEARQAASPAAPAECTVAGGPLAPQDAEAVAKLRQTVDAGPLYAMLAASTSVASCSISVGESGRIALDYRFRDGASLRVTHDPRIEYNNQEVHLASPPAEDAVAVLTRVERAGFGADGCGIDWREADTQAAGNEPNVTETIYRGDVCNCQARVRRDTGGRVVGLVFRSAC